MGPDSLVKANELVLKAIERVEDQVVLGFLPLSHSEEDAVLEQVKSKLQATPRLSIKDLLPKAPAAISYALAVAPSRTCQSGREFWNSYEIDLGREVPVNHRGDLASAFRRICRNLGVLDGTIADTAHKHTAPFLFQAGILHRWKDHLSQGVRQALRESPAPDAEDPVGLQNFTYLVRDKVQQGQINLRGLLETPAGPVLVQRLITAYQSQDWAQLPAHLQQPMAEAFAEAGKGLVLRAPFLAYSPEFQQLELVLPAQSSRIASADTYWRIGSRRHVARKETSIPVAELDSSNVTVQLCHLQGNYKEQSFSLDVSLDDKTPFRVFNKRTRRERRASSSDRITIPPGEYFVAMLPEMITNDEEYVTDHYGIRLLELDLQPGDDPLVLRLDSQQWEIEAELRPVIYFDQEIDRTTPIVEGGDLHYGNNLGLIAIFPEQGVEQESFLLKVSCTEQGIEHNASVPVGIADNGRYKVQSELIAPVSKVMDQLPPGIHFLKVSLSHANGRVDHQFWYWKGLERISQLLGFQCSEHPVNIELTRCRGLVKTEDGIHFIRDYHAPTVTIALSTPVAELSLRRAGIQARVTEPGEDWDFEPNPVNPLIVTSNDKRVLRFTSGGYQTWKIYGNDKQITELDQKKTGYVISLAGIASELDGTGQISARSEEGKDIPLLSFTRPLTATNLRKKINCGQSIVSWSFEIPATNLHSLGVLITDLTAIPQIPDRDAVSITEDMEGRQIDETSQFMDGAINVSVQRGVVGQRKWHGSLAEELSNALGQNDEDPERENLEETCHVAMDIDERALEGRLILIDIYRKTAGKEEWNTLDSAEKYGYSKMRLLAWSKGPVDPESGWWQLLQQVSHPDNKHKGLTELTEALETITSGDLEQGLAACRGLLEWKYPTEVWKENAHQVPEIPVFLGKHRFGLSNETASIWWRQAGMELSSYAAGSYAPILRYFLIGSQPEVLTVPRYLLGHSSEPESATITDRCWNLPNQIHAAGSHKEFFQAAMQEDSISSGVVHCYENLARVSTGKDSDLRNFGLRHFLVGGVAGIEGMEARVEGLHEQAARFKVNKLLSPEHLLYCVRMINRRTRSIEQAVRDDQMSPMSTLAQSIERMHQRLDQVAPDASRILGWDQHEARWWTPPLLENPHADKMAGIVWAIAAISRSTAYERFSSKEYMELMRSLLCNNEATEERLRERLCLALTIAPELFAFYVALFECCFTQSRRY